MFLVRKKLSLQIRNSQLKQHLLHLHKTSLFLCNKFSCQLQAQPIFKFYLKKTNMVFSCLTSCAIQLLTGCALEQISGRGSKGVATSEATRDSWGDGKEPTKTAHSVEKIGEQHFKSSQILFFEIFCRVFPFLSPSSCKSDSLNLTFHLKYSNISIHIVYIEKYFNHTIFNAMRLRNIFARQLNFLILSE